MLKLAVIFLIAGLVLGALGFGGIGGAFVGIAKILFFIALALFLIFLVLGVVAGKKVKDSV
ncbi:hypothetical protein GCM10022253_12620 [Sphingomonas endophytica]|jgi:uncharacterized membrane protein YtjA (UPF0391 family)|uniref:UPF0391 membrane protein F4693_003047 n=1 Tax=Sphingomonas endophytica TaxID=869719 RepID=A0A7X0JEG0_9SPHN|nr:MULTISPECIES: DUF1328 family protein [Sphingomonas]MBB5725968.1 uncharacterized membrane protein YtjA (UPF0391 family) [Sphingomonas endophytica]MBB6506050.1 uncharacterized membrane protein YtjA (UPF0391 family) [Sphingomonas endophytica]VXC81378.1 conserved hypothetical protein [Sphingomonas sp. 8AM]